MDAHLIFWSAALVNMAAMFALVVAGVRHVRAGRIAQHRRAMLSATSLVVLFLVSYVVKARLIGGEDLAVWSAAARTNLYVHETCVTLMLLAGVFAGSRAWRMRGTRNVTRDPADEPAPASTVRWHRRAGWTAVSAAGLGLATAIFVLVGMFSRAG